MPWNPDIYNQFKEKRYEPFYDMLGHLRAKPGMKILDLGCGTGELTQLLANRMEAGRVLGIDSSAEMLEKAPFQENIEFVQRSIEEQLADPEKWDLIFANASLQWVNDHSSLFYSMVERLLPGGQIAVQMPSQKENLLNQLLLELVHEVPWYDEWKDSIRSSPMLSLDEYTRLLFQLNAKDILVYQKVYPIIADSIDTLYAFISGSALIPYLEQLQEPVKTRFTTAYKEKINRIFTSVPMVYAFKRMVLVASF